MTDKNSELVNWFKKSVGTEKCCVELKGIGENGSGYTSDIYFAEVTLVEPNPNGQQLSLVAKVSKSNLTEEGFKREMVFYKDIVPIFLQFQTEKNIKEPFEAIPKCYKVFVGENADVIVQENMKNKGYNILHDRSKPMNINHIKLGLKTYAKFHAISLALREQKPDIFNKIKETCGHVIPVLFPKIIEIYEILTSKLISTLNEVGRKDLAERYKNLIMGGVIKNVIDFFKDGPNEKVLAHSDCHNGNFMFEYKEGDKENPSNMVLLDFQLCSVFSPMIDIGLFFYWGLSKKELDNLPELLDFYHKELSSFLSQLGSDVNKLFPVSLMWQHWKKYSYYGFIVASLSLDILFVEPEDAPDMESKKSFLDMKLNDKDQYLERLVGIIEHYLNCNEIK